MQQSAPARYYRSPRMTTSSSVPSTSGISVLDLLHSLTEMLGSDVIERAKARLPAHLRAEIEGLTAVAWLPNTTLALLIDEIASCAGRDPESMIDQAVR